ncbi:MAG: hypothetical protein ABW003_24810, partial [Microvirga sp.]
GSTFGPRQSLDDMNEPSASDTVVAQLIEIFSRELHLQFMAPPEEMFRKADQRVTADRMPSVREK